MDKWLIIPDKKEDYGYLEWYTNENASWYK